MGIGMVPALDAPFGAEAEPSEAALSEPDASFAGASPAGAAPPACGGADVNAFGPATVGGSALSRSANAWEGAEDDEDAEDDGSSAVGGRPMCTVPGMRKAVVVSAFTSAGGSDVSSESAGSSEAPPCPVSNVSRGITPVASGSKGASVSSTASLRTSEEPVFPLVMPSPSRCLTLTIMRPRTTPE
ncbi:hypothetical protein ACFFV7_07545 [Nonomuraea spiralis]|uniref:Uncharacterized protein n=1 Tax=Nonomuraea spiralis TaxID=46182 RepID=A0ABV5IAF2_9ACTN|nr:hypothetical protein [Nonomuraea spiralis]